MANTGDLKKADKDLLNAIQSGTALKHSDTAEKNSLPSAEVISQEKTIKGIEGFDKNQLKHGETQEKQGWKEAVSQENTLKSIESFNKDQLKPGETQEKQGWKEALIHEKTTEVVTKFDKCSLKHTETAEKNSLPDVSAIEGEKKELAHRKSIGEFDKKKLNRRNTEEKIVLPNKEVIDQEKKEVELRNSIGKYDKGNMNKVDVSEGGAMKESVEKDEADTGISSITASTSKNEPKLIAQEQTHKNIANFNRSSLKHADTAEKNTLPSDADIQAEKKN